MIPPALAEAALGIENADDGTCSLVLLDVASVTRSDSSGQQTQDRSKAKKGRPNPKNHLGKSGGVYFNHDKHGNVMKHIITPKIVKSDVRRYYAAMFCNAYNSCSFDLMLRYMDTFYHRDVSFRDIPSASMQAQGDKIVHVSGIAAVAAGWEAMLGSTPDLSISIADTSLRVRSDDTALVQFSFIMCGSTLVAVGGHGGDDDDLNGNGGGLVLPSLPPLAEAGYSDTAPGESQADSASNGAAGGAAADPWEYPELPLSDQSLTDLQSNSELLQRGAPAKAVPFRLEGVATMRLAADSRVECLQLNLINAVERRNIHRLLGLLCTSREPLC